MNPGGEHGGHGAHSGGHRHGGHHHPGAVHHHHAGPNPNFAPENNRMLLAGPRTVGGLRCRDVGREVEEQLVLLTGGRDRRGGALLTLGQNPRRERAKPDDYRRLLEYLLSLPWYIFMSLKYLKCQSDDPPHSWKWLRLIVTSKNPIASFTAVSLDKEVKMLFT